MLNENTAEMYQIINNWSLFFGCLPHHNSNLNPLNFLLQRKSLVMTSYMPQWICLMHIYIYICANGTLLCIECYDLLYKDSYKYISICLQSHLLGKSLDVSNDSNISNFGNQYQIILYKPLHTY